MTHRLPAVLAALLATVACGQAAADVDDIINFKMYSPGFASSGQPNAEQLEALKASGYERVVYVAYSDHNNSLEHEDRLVKELGMEFVQIPVEWESPTPNDFALVAAAIDTSPGKTLLHCQVNYRASAFSLLYRVLYEDVPLAEAKADMNEIWSPNETWRTLIFNVLEAHGVSPDCDGCDWSTDDE